MPGITLIGLGPGDPAMLTREAWDIISSVDEIHLRTCQHPTVASLPSTLKIRTFDSLYEHGESFEEVYDEIVAKVLELGQRPQGVLYGVPGDPFVAEATGPEIARRAKLLGIPVRIISGISFLEPVFAALGLDPYPRLLLMDAIELSQAHVAAFPPDMPLLIAQIYSKMVAAEVKMTLNTVYPDEHPVRLIHAAGTKDEIVEDIPLFEIDRSKNTGLLTALFLPPLGEGTSFEAFQELVAHLRASDGCPWDREQTHQSLRPHLMEEAYEVLEALDADDPVMMAEELGDLLLQIMLNAQIASEEGEFGINDVLRGIYTKIIRRHPHVFGDVRLSGVEGVLKNWEKLKAEERQGEGKEKGLLDGVPQALPALTQAQEYQDRASRVGFDWNEVDGVLDKIREEINEVRNISNQDELADELGDLFFALVNLCRWKKVDAEAALRRVNLKFRTRFAYLEKGAQVQNKNLADMTMDEMDALWQAAKKS
jgi:tetrapyrrole methylase family protein / MazG family protein